MNTQIAIRRSTVFLAPLLFTNVLLSFQVFSEAKVYFSIGGKQYSEHPVSFVTMEDCIFEDPKNISIKLLHRVGAYVKIELYWAAKWIMISEITFESSKFP